MTMLKCHGGASVRSKWMLPNTCRGISRLRSGCQVLKSPSCIFVQSYSHHPNNSIFNFRHQQVKKKAKGQKKPTNLHPNHHLLNHLNTKCLCTKVNVTAAKPPGPPRSLRNDTSCVTAEPASSWAVGSSLSTRSFPRRTLT